MTSPIKRILVVDDHDAVRRGVRQLLETKPYYQVVAEAADGRTALALARETRPDIAILDYSIPQLNGLDLSHALKANSPGSKSFSTRCTIVRRSSWMFCVPV